MSTHLVLNAFLYGVGHHEAAWRLPETVPGAAESIGHYQNLARIAERGRLDSVFFADSPSLQSNPARTPPHETDPTILLAAIAAVTAHIGLIATASTTFEEPYGLARKFASLDHISGGRAGWNSVTSAAPAAAGNFGLDTLPDHADRYARADEFIDVVTQLWNSWDVAAIEDDKVAGVYADPEQIRPIDHEGEHFRVAGPLTLPRSPQGHPVVVQAGSSDAGVALAARYAEAVFTAQRTLPEAQAFYARLKGATQAAGRNPEQIKILPGIVPFIGATEQEAKALEREFADLLVHEHARLQLAEQTGIPAEHLELDRPLPDHVRPVHEVQGAKHRYELILNLARTERLTVRQLIAKLGGGRGHRNLAGTPEQIADDLTEWFTHGAADGFNIMAPALPSGLEAFVEHVVPILQERGLFRTEYTGTTLRENYGLPVPRARDMTYVTA